MNRSAASGGPQALLRDLRASATRRAEGLVAAFDGIVDAASDVATDDEHDPEGHTIAWERQQIAALLDDTNRVLAEIDAADERLQEGQYGACITCGEPISADRLLALPAAAACIACAR